uniref:DUF4629 domain-containing protein n=1 Tax=Pipistrellus kuhlii TaxID=59472 RepID=A0A7J7VTU4_PIPKU|nr:hypothetical protein mPipKuh1_001821 [Pipistrellus kuhlii]
MSENFQNPPLRGTSKSLQLSLPVGSTGASITGRVCSLPRVSAPAVTSGWLLPSVSGTSFQPLMVMENSLGMKTSLGLQPLSQTFCLPQTPEFPKSFSGSNIQILDSNPSPELGDISMAAPVQSPSIYLALPPAPSQEQKENRNLEDITTMLSKPLDAYQIPTENQDPPLLPLEIPNIPQLLACIDPLGQEEQPGYANAGLGKSSLGLKDQATVEIGIESNDGFADIATLVEDTHLPLLLNSLDELDQSKGPKVIKTKDGRAISLDEVQKQSSVINAPSDQARRNKHKASELISGEPMAKIQRESPDCMFVGEVAVSNAAANDRAPENRAKNSNKTQKTAPSRTSKTKSHGQEKSKRTKEYNARKTEENKQSGNNIKAEEKPTIPKMKRRKNQPELIQETFKKPRSSLGMHMLESVQVFHALGKKPDKKTEHSSSRALGNSSNPKGPQPSLAIKKWLDSPCEGKGPEKTQVKCQKPDGSAEKECPSPSEYELPPPGKVKLVPLIFPTLDKPQARPVPRRPLSLVSRRPAGANPAQPGSKSAQPTAVNSSKPTPESVTGPARPTQPVLTNPVQSDLTSAVEPGSHPAQLTAVSSSQPTPASLTDSAKPPQPISTNSVQPGWTNPIRPSVPQGDASRPAPYKTSTFTTFQREPIRTAVNKPWTPPKPQNQYLLQDFACQRLPWRKPDISGPVMSTPITNEQRPEREAMKRKAQLERENAAKFTSMGKMQYFIEREKEMDISRYYGYVK